MCRLFGKYLFIEFCQSSKSDIFHYARPKKKKKSSHVLILPPVSSEKSKHWEAVKLRVADTGLP